MGTRRDSAPSLPPTHSCNHSRLPTGGQRRGEELPLRPDLRGHHASSEDPHPGCQVRPSPRASPSISAPVPTSSAALCPWGQTDVSGKPRSSPWWWLSRAGSGGSFWLSTPWEQCSGPRCFAYLLSLVPPNLEAPGIPSPPQCPAARRVSLQDPEVPGGQEEVQGDLASLRCQGCHRAVLGRPPGHARQDKKPADAVSSPRGGGGGHTSGLPWVSHH